MHKNYIIGPLMVFLTSMSSFASDTPTLNVVAGSFDKYYEYRRNLHEKTAHNLKTIYVQTIPFFTQREDNKNLQNLIELHQEITLFYENIKNSKDSKIKKSLLEKQTSLLNALSTGSSIHSSTEGSNKISVILNKALENGDISSIKLVVGCGSKPHARQNKISASLCGRQYLCQVLY